MFESLDFVYLPSRDVTHDLERFSDGMGGEVIFAIEAFGTRVAMVQLRPGRRRLSGWLGAGTSEQPWLRIGQPLGA